MLFALIGTGAVVAVLACWAVWRLTRSRRQAKADVICLGYDNQDNVSSMRDAMLERVRRGDIDV
jgi:hypothetical protein